jgi:hypothetical protein
MGKCKIVPKNGQVNEKRVKVDMFKGAVSKADSLYTSGFGPCMCMIVHSPGKSAGGMADVAANKRPVHHLKALISHMVDQIGGVTKIQLFLIQRSGFTDKIVQAMRAKSSDYKFWELEWPKFPEYLKKFLPKLEMDIFDMRGDLKIENILIEEVLYAPGEDKIYIGDMIKPGEFQDEKSVHMMSNTEISGFP